MFCFSVSRQQMLLSSESVYVPLQEADCFVLVGCWCWSSLLLPVGGLIIPCACCCCCLGRVDVRPSAFFSSSMAAVAGVCPGVGGVACVVAGALGACFFRLVSITVSARVSSFSSSIVLPNIVASAPARDANICFRSLLVRTNCSCGAGDVAWCVGAC